MDFPAPTRMINALLFLALATLSNATNASTEHTENRRRLPCPGASKCGDSVKKCIYAWHRWSECSTSPPYIKTRDISIYQYPQGGAPPCPESPQTKACAPVDCQGYWTSWGECDHVTGQQSRVFIETVKKEAGGSDCDTSSPSVRSCTADPNKPKSGCIYTWSDWSSCSNEAPYRKHRTIQIASPPENGGAECPNSPEYKVCRAVDCAGEWGSWSPCSTVNHSHVRQWTMTHASMYGGKKCPFDDNRPIHVESRSCIIAEWHYYPGQGKNVWETPLLQRQPLPRSTELSMVACPLGSNLELRWSVDSQNTVHDVWELPSAENFDRCDFSDPAAKQLATETSSNTLIIPCMEPLGTRYFACSVGDACSKGFQRLRVHTFDPHDMKSKNSSTSLADVFTEYLIPLTYDKNKLTEESEAENIMTKLRYIADHAPDSCSDWLPAESNSLAACRAFAETDMGYIERIRPQPNRLEAKKHYAEAIRLKPDWCGAYAYLTELFLEEEVQGQATAQSVEQQYQKACKVCDAGSGLLTVQLEFAQRSREIPDCSEAIHGRDVMLTTTTAPNNAGMSGSSPSSMNANEPQAAAQDSSDKKHNVIGAVPISYILVPILVACGVPCFGFYCLAQCTQREDSLDKYDGDTGENSSDAEGEVSESDIIIEMVKQASLHTCRVGSDEDEDDNGKHSMRGDDTTTRARDAGRSSDKSASSGSLMRMARRIGARSAQSRALASDHIVLQEESGDSDAFDGDSSSDDQNSHSGAGDSYASAQYELPEAREVPHVQLQEADDFD